MTISFYPNSNKIRHPFLGYKQPKTVRAQISKTLTGRKLKLSTRKKLSKIRRGKHPTDKSREKMSKSRIKFLKLHPQKHTKETKLKIRAARLTQKIPGKNTIPEKAIQKELKNRQIKFIKHKPIICCIPDVFIEPNICIFADGDFYHAHPHKYKPNDIVPMINKKAKDIRLKDKKINKELIKNNYKVLRFWETDIKKDIGSIGDRIQLEIMHD
jgi:DNA mismatch endonuclease, patch repair protein